MVMSISASHRASLLDLESQTLTPSGSVPPVVQASSSHCLWLDWFLPSGLPESFPCYRKRRVCGEDLLWLIMSWVWTTQLCLYILSWAFPGGTEVKNQPAKAGDARDPDLIPGSGRSPEEEMATHSSVLAWRIPGMEEPGGLPSVGSHRVGHD